MTVFAPSTLSFSVCPLQPEGHFQKVFSSLDFLGSYYLFMLHIPSPNNKHASEEAPRLLRLHSSVFAEDTSHTQSCYMNTGDGLWHLVKRSMLMLHLLQRSLPIEMNKTVNPVLKSAATSRTHQHHAMSDFSIFERGNSSFQLPSTSKQVMSFPRVLIRR